MKIYEITEQGYGSQQQGRTGVIKRVSGKNLEIEDPDNPGVKTTVDMTKTDIDTDDKGQPVVNLNNKAKPSTKKKSNLTPNTKVKINTEK